MRKLSCSLLACVTLHFPLGAAEETYPAVLSQSSPALQNLTPGGESYVTAMTPDGRYVLFTSTAPDLVAPTNNVAPFAHSATRFNVFLRDHVEGKTRLISAGLTGLQDGDGDSLPVAVSTNGQFVLFESTSSNLVANDTNNASDVFLHNVANRTTILVSAAVDGGSGNGTSDQATMTPDGRYVAFVSSANNLGPVDTNNIPDVYVRDTVAQTTVLGSAGAISANATSQSGEPRLSEDGRYVAFSSSATNLVSGVSRLDEIYVRDLVLNSNHWASIDARSILQSVRNTTNGASFTPLLSQDGRFVVFQIQGTGAGLLLRYDRQTSGTQLISTNVHASSPIRSALSNVAISTDGRKVAVIENVTSSSTCIRYWDDQGTSTVFSSDGTGTTQPASTCHWPAMAPGGQWLAYVGREINGSLPNLGYNIVFRDLQNNATHMLNQQEDGNRFAVSGLTGPSLSANGMLVAFDTTGTGLLFNDRNKGSDVFVRNRTNNYIQLVSKRHLSPQTAGFYGVSANAASALSRGAISGDGSRTVFASDADNLVGDGLAGDGNGVRDVFVRNVELGTTVLASAATNGTPGNAFSWEGTISSNGQFVAFTSRASNLVAGDTNNATDVFRRDLNSGVTELVSIDSFGVRSAHGPSTQPVLSHDGRFVAFRSTASGLVFGASTIAENLYLRDMQNGLTRLLINAAQFDRVLGPVMTPDAAFLACGVNGYSPYWKVWNNTTQQFVFSNKVSNLTHVLAISSDLKVVYATTNGIVASHLQRGSNQVLAPFPAPFHAGGGFSQDGRFLVYSAAMPNGQVFLHDFVTSSNILISRNFETGDYASGHSDSPTISADGRFIVYRSDAADIVSGDHNKTTDIFVFDRVSNTTTLVSANWNGSSSGNSWSHSPRLAADGRTLIFSSRASDLAEKDLNDHQDLFIYRIDDSGPFLIYIDISNGAQPRIIWPVRPGSQYQVQYKDSLDAPVWEELNATILVNGSQASAVDPTASAPLRIYRVVED